jgi:hypothetical protein
VLYNHKLMAEGGRRLSDNPFWFFVMENAPGRLYDGYKITLYGLVSVAVLSCGALWAVHCVPACVPPGVCPEQRAVLAQPLSARGCVGAVGPSDALCSM